jgi:hypothetical protein
MHPRFLPPHFSLFRRPVPLLSNPTQRATSIWSIRVLWDHIVTLLFWLCFLVLFHALLGLGVSGPGPLLSADSVLPHNLNHVEGKLDNMGPSISSFNLQTQNVNDHYHDSISPTGALGFNSYVKSSQEDQIESAMDQIITPRPVPTSVSAPVNGEIPGQPYPSSIPEKTTTTPYDPPSDFIFPDLKLFDRGLIELLTSQGHEARSVS